MTERLGDWISGRLSGDERVLTAIAPAILLLAYALGAALLYALRNRLRGRFQDEEIDSRGDGGFTTRGLKHFFAWTMRPWWQLLARVRFPPNAVTSLSLVVALGAGVAVAAGRFALGGWLFVTAGALDFVDGRLARSTGRTSLGGAALDSVLDRYVEGALIAGLCWYYRHDWALAVCLCALTGSFLVPYVRARGEALGVHMKDSGFMQRPERVLLLGLGTALSPILEVLISPGDPHPPHWLAVAALTVLAVGSHVSAVQRLVRLLRTVDERAPSSSGGARRPLKSALSNVAATALDFALATLLVHVALAQPAFATAAGCALGAVTSFALSRHWAFDAGAGGAAAQAGRYAAVSLVTMALNAGGVALLSLLQLPFVVAWVLARAVIFAAWSYPLQRDFVFAESRPEESPAPGIVAPEPSGVSHS